MHPHRYIWRAGHEAEASRFNKTLPEKPRAKHERSLWRNQQRILYTKLATWRPGTVYEGGAEYEYWMELANKYRNPKGRWMK